MIHSIKPTFRVFLLGFIPYEVTSVSKRYSYDEIVALESPIEIPSNMIARINFKDSVSGGSFKIDLPKGARNDFFTNGQRIRIRELFRPGRLIVITEDDKTKFAGRISESSHRGGVRGESEYTVTGEGLEEAISSQILFIDFDNSKPPSNTISVEVAAKSPGSRLQIALQTVLNAIKETKSPTLMMQSLADSAIKHLLSNGKYGGREFFQMVDTLTGLDQEPYTIAFLHTLQWLNSQNFGNTLSIWSLMESLAKPPLYELFFHYDQSVDFYISGENKSLFIPKKYESVKITSPDTLIGTLVYRKTPFQFLDSVSLSKDTMQGLVVEVDQSYISNFELTESTADIFSGVHVNVGIFDNIMGLMLNPVTYSPQLLAEFGQRVLSIVLDGSGFPKEVDTAAAQSTFNLKLNEMQAKIFNTFGTGERIFSGSFSGGYFRGVSKGMIMEIVNKDGGVQSRSLNGDLEIYDPRFYITGIDVTWIPGAGKADQTISVKWGKRKLDPMWDQKTIS
ncbi:hypothetical protein [Leptospira noguchii]|uniref:hypothetical protein n=1 Tax=Leptospira noguchii TaxID=28182 RepID=UPI0007743FBE|nr:hypothetical protein [Leptospira noguchii]